MQVYVGQNLIYEVGTIAFPTESPGSDNTATIIGSSVSATVVVVIVVIIFFWIMRRSKANAKLYNNSLAQVELREVKGDHELITCHLWNKPFFFTDNHDYEEHGKGAVTMVN